MLLASSDMVRAITAWVIAHIISWWFYHKTAGIIHIFHYLVFYLTVMYFAKIKQHLW
jgi:hypothetical protein